MYQVDVGIDLFLVITMEVGSSWPDHLPTLSAAKASNLALHVKHHILAIDEASQQQPISSIYLKYGKPHGLFREHTIH